MAAVKRQLALEGEHPFSSTGTPSSPVKQPRQNIQVAKKRMTPTAKSCMRQIKNVVKQ